MTPPPQINATLLAISTPNTGFTEDYDRDADPLTPLWTGESGAYVQERLKSLFNPQGSSDRLVDYTVFVDSDVAVQVNLKPGHTLTMQYQGRTYNVRAAQVANSTLDGVGGSCKVGLEEMGEDQVATP